jgi:hypothetical protein
MEFYSNIFIGLLSGIGSGFISSICFLKFFLSKKIPRIKISDYISKQSINNQECFIFKFVNLTNSELFDVRFNLIIFTPVGDLNGPNIKVKEIKLSENFMAYISTKSKNDKFNSFAVRILTKENLDELWEQNTFLRLTIIAKHSYSGFNKVYTKDFLKDNISTKGFVSGESLEVK